MGTNAPQIGLPAASDFVASSPPGVGARAADVLILLLVVAVSAEPTDLLGAASSMLDRDVAVNELELLLLSGSVVRRQGKLSVRDELTAASIYETATPADLTAAHRAWSGALMDGPWGLAWREAVTCKGPDALAAGRAASAALSLQQTGRHDAATDLFEQAARLSVSATERGRLLASAAACAYAAGMEPRGRALVHAAGRLELTEPARRVVTVLEASFRASDVPVDIPWPDQVVAADLLRTWDQPSAAFTVLAGSVTRRWVDNCPAAGTTSADRPGEQAVAGLAHLRSGRTATALPLLRRAAADLDALGEHGAAVPAYTIVGEVAACLGQVPVATAALARAGRLIAATGQTRWSARVELTRALLAARCGSVETSSASVIREAMLSATTLERDRAGLVHAVGLLGGDRPDEAYDVLSELVERSGGPRPELLAWGLLSHLADAARHSGRGGEARKLVSRLNGIEGLFEYDVTLAELLYATAVLSEPGHHVAGFEVLLSHDPSRWPWLHARAHLAYGEHLRRNRRVSEARPHLMTARRLFEAMGTVPWERRAGAELRATGFRDVSRAATAASQPPQLSPQELEIARLASHGLTNREIGRTLYLSPRTVGSHLYRIFPKLDIRSRNQLSAVLAPFDPMAGATA